MIDKEKIKYLLLAYQNDQISKEEYIQYIEILNDELYQPLVEEVLDEQWGNLNDDEIKNTSFAGYHHILTQIKGDKNQPSKTKLWPKILIAAAIFLMICGGIFYTFNGQFSFAEKEQFANDIAPGKNGAVLTLANGRKILISDKQQGNVAEEAGVKITRSKDGILIYEILNQEVKQATKQFNTLTTSRGEQIQVRLQDGTLVFLNTESTIKYPINFINAEERKVDFTGEAYFEVAEDKKHPFLINTTNDFGLKQQIKVLGTSFNIHSYPEEASIFTTLLKGSVSVAVSSQNEIQKTVKLIPGEQSIANEGSINVKKPIVDDVVAWKNGYFMFDNETLENIMKKVARWYDIKVIYQDEALKNKTFFGSVSKFEHVSEILKLLQKTDGVKFEIEDKQILIYNAK
ncbi:MAG: FecR family protein [Flavobacterium sp.]|nr:MAG: FecR family protein [Flavobacterium sp.]